MNKSFPTGEETFVELDPEYYISHSPEDDSIFSQMISLYERTFLSNGQDETSIDKIIEIFLSKRYKIYVLLRNNKKTVVALAIVSMLTDHVDFCHLDYICVDESARGGGTGSRFMKDYLAPTLHTLQKHITLECEHHIMGWYLKLGAIKLPILDSIFAGRRFSFLVFQRPGITTAESENNISEALTERVMGELRVKFHGFDEEDMSSVRLEDVYNWELLD
mgnify:CR=1 FL=1